MSAIYHVAGPLIYVTRLHQQQFCAHCGTLLWDTEEAKLGKWCGGPYPENMPIERGDGWQAMVLENREPTCEARA